MSDDGNQERALGGLWLRALAALQRWSKKMAPAEVAEAIEEMAAELPLALPRPGRELPAEFHVRSGWSKPKPESLPRPTYAPAFVALGIMFFALGLVTRWYIAASGGVVTALGFWGWIKELISD